MRGPVRDVKGQNFAYCIFFLHKPNGGPDQDEAYNRGKEKIGVDVVAITEEYGHSELPCEDIRKLFAAGMSSFFFKEISGEDFIDDEEEYEYNLKDAEAYAKLYMWIATIGNPALMYDFVENNAGFLYIGGYGVVDS